MIKLRKKEVSSFCDTSVLEESDIPGVYFNEFRESVDEEGNVLSPSDLDAIRYKDDYEDDYYR